MRLLRLVCVAVTLLVALFAMTAEAETPTPSPTVEPTPTPEAFCGDANVHGGRVYAAGSMEVTLPAGTYTIAISPPGPDQPTLTFCQRETGGTVELNTTTCAEVSRVAASPEAKAVVDAIVASCRIGPTPTIVPPPLLCPQGEPVAGGGALNIQNAIQVTLPAGNFRVQVDNGVAQICNLGGQYMLALRLSDCTRPDITPPNAPTQDVMDRIVASCVLLNPVTPQPEPTFSPPSGIITPPSTGDAGLKAAGGSRN